MLTLDITSLPGRNVLVAYLSGWKVLLLSEIPQDSKFHLYSSILALSHWIHGSTIYNIESPLILKHLSL